MERPLVSVYVLAYQAEAYIEDCIKSILSQSYPNIEFLLLDDASKDATLQIVDKYIPELRKKCVRVKIIRHKKNSGHISHNVNELIKQCKGDYIKGIAGDDALCSDYLEEMVQYLEENKDCAIAYCNGYIIPDTWHLGQRNPHKLFYRNHKPVPFENMTEELLRVNFISAPSALIRKSVFEKYGYYDESMKYEDWEMWLRLARYEHFGYLNKKLIYYRESTTGVSRKNTRKKIIDSYQFDMQVLNKYLPVIENTKRKAIRERHIKKAIHAAIKQRYYDLALILWIAKTIKTY